MKQLFEGVIKHWKRREGAPYVKLNLKTKEQLIQEFTEAVQQDRVSTISFLITKTDHSFTSVNYTETSLICKI